MTITLTILGCGSSGGVPRPAAGWGACDPNNPKNRRRRCSIMLERKRENQKTVVVVDTSPDFREQMISADVKHVDAILYTHDHADHTHGIDDVRPIVLNMRKIMPTFMTAETSASLHTKFGYCYVSPPGSDYPPIVEDFRLIPGHMACVDGAGGTINALPFTVQHGGIDALGFRFGDVAYTPDLNGIPDVSRQALTGLDLWVVDALRHTPHPSHFTVSEALYWIETLKPKRAILTNLHTDLDYETLKAQLPEHVTPAYDGLTVDITRQP